MGLTISGPGRPVDRPPHLSHYGSVGELTSSEVGTHTSGATTTAMAPRLNEEQKWQLQQGVSLAAFEGKARDINQLLSGLEPDQIEEILHRKSNIRGEYGTPLTIAAGRGQLEVVQLLVERFHVPCDHITNTDTNGVNLRGVTALMCAASRGHLDVVKYLVTKGSDINLKSYFKKTPLYLACRNGSLEVVKYLVESGARVEDADHCDRSCLMVACDRRSEELVQYLLDKGADTSRKDDFHLTALHKATFANAPEILELLLKSGAIISNLPPGVSPLIEAAYRCQRNAVRVFVESPSVTRKEKIDALELLGATIAERYMDEGFRYLHQAMVERYKDPSEIIAKPHSPLPILHGVVESQSVEELEARQFDPDTLRLECLAIVRRIYGVYGSLPIFLAYSEQLRGAGRYKEAVSLQLFTMKDVQNEDLFHVSKFPVATFPATFKDMMINGQTPLFSTVLEVVELFLRRISRLRDPWKKSVLERLCLQHILVGLTVARGQEEGRLLQQQTKRFVRLLPTLSCGCPLLREAVVSYWNREWELNSVQDMPFDLLVSFLIQCGADVNAMDGQRNRPLHAVACLSPPEDDCEMLCGITRILVQAGALVGVQNSQGETPLDVAATEAVAAILQEHFPVSLKSLAASAVVRHQIPHAGEIPRDLEEFVQYH